MSKVFLAVAATAVCIVLAACGGGGGSPGTGTTPMPVVSGASATDSVTGTVPVPLLDTSASPTSPAPASFITVRDQTARFNAPTDVAIDTLGNLFVLDGVNTSIRRIAASGNVSTVPVRLNSGSGLEIDSAGNLYTVDTGTLRRIAPGGAVTNLATGLAGVSYITIDAAGDLYLLDSVAAAIYRFTPQSGILTIAFSGPPLSGQARGIARDTAGNFYIGVNNGNVWMIPPAGAPRSVAIGFALIADLRADASGNLYVTEFFPRVCTGASNFTCVNSPYTSEQSLLTKISPNGGVATIAGGSTGSADGTGTAAHFGLANGMAIGRDGSVFVADTQNHTIRKVTTTGVVTTIAGVALQPGSAD